jgi:hypothetical protein
LARSQRPLDARSKSTAEANDIVSDASAFGPTLDLVEELAEPLAEYLLSEYANEDWRDSPLIETLARVAALLEVGGREVPPSVLDALRKAAEAGRPIGVA